MQLFREITYKQPKSSMMYFSKVTSVLIHYLLAFCSIGLVTGCVGETHHEILPETIQPPETFTSDEVKWRREDQLGKSDASILSYYFQKFPSMIDSPTLEGTPTVYHATKKRRRFYWIKGTTDQPVWACVHFDKGGFQYLEGQGSPYKNNHQ